MADSKISPWGLIGAGAGGSASGWSNPANKAMPYMNQIPDMLQKYLSPYIDAGNQALPGLQDQYGKLITDPGARMNEIGASYQQSPGFQFSLDQALQGSDHAAAAGGMAGSPQHEFQNMDIATQMANQDYNNYMSNALGMYKTGLSGNQSIYNTGAQTGMAMGEDMASVLANQAKLAYLGQNAKNQSSGGMWGAIGEGIGSLF
jgi:hypothetical protein